MSADLFGEEVSFAEITKADRNLARVLLRELERDNGQLTGLRVQLRQSMLAARPEVPLERGLAIAELRLAWLLTAEQQGDAACREVTEATFTNAAPVMREDWQEFERSLAAELALAGELSFSGSFAEQSSIPDWAYEDAGTAINLSADAVRTAHANPSSAVRCTAMIALHEAMLARRDEATPAALSAL